MRLIWLRCFRADRRVYLCQRSKPQLHRRFLDRAFLAFRPAVLET